MWLCPVGTQAQVASSAGLQKVVKEMKATIASEKKDMLKIYPKFGSINNITASSVKRASDKLSGGSMADMVDASALDFSFANINICNWYINKINSASSASAKYALANEYQELKSLLDQMRSYLGNLAALENFGGSMASLDYAVAAAGIYEAWYKALKASPRVTQRAAAADAKKMVSKMRRNWKAKYDETREYADGYELSLLNDINADVVKTIDKVEALVGKKAPYTWVLKLI